MNSRIESSKLEAAVEATREAAALAFSKWRQDRAPDARVWEKRKGHPVCDADLDVDALLKPKLAEILPEAGWLSEETADDPARLDTELVWLVDPIDGTRDYVRGRKGWCVSVALARRGKPVFAVMEAPATGQLWLAQAGQGASCNGQAISASRRSAFKGARVPADPHKLLSDMRIVRKPNSIAMRMALIACDKADLVATLRWGHEWDIAAAHLIAEEAGARVSDAQGDDILYNKPKPLDFGLMCSAPDIHAEAIGWLSERAAKISAENSP